jgi:hypothetical protein
MTFCGWPLVGDAQLRWLYPPNLSLLALEPVTAFSFLTIGYIGLATAGMWFYLRRAAGVGPWPAACGAATLGLSGFFACHLMSGIVVFPAAGAWVPWILMLGWRVGRVGGVRTIAWFAAAIGAQVFSGAPQIMFYTWVALILQMLWCLTEGFARNLRSNVPIAAVIGRALGIPFRYAVGAGLGAAIGASSLIPTREFGALSFQRGGQSEFEYVSDCSLAPRYLWLFVAPKFFGDPHNEGFYWGGREGYWEICGYMGVGPLAALFIALLSWRSLFGGPSKGRLHVEGDFNRAECRRDLSTLSPASFAAFHLVLGGLALFLAFGRYNPFYRGLFEWVPGFSSFRVPSRWLLFLQFSLATLLALVLERILGETKEHAAPARRSLIAVGGLIAFGVVAALRSPQVMEAAGVGEYRRDFNPLSGRPIDLQLQSWTAGSLWRAAGFSLGWLILFTIAGKRIRPVGRQMLPVAAACLVLADVLHFGLSMTTTRTREGQTREFYPESALVKSLRAELAGHRLLALDDVLAWYHSQDTPELWANRATIQGLHDARGYYPICLRWFGHFINALSGRSLRTPMGSLPFVEPTLDPSLLATLDVKCLLSYEKLPVPGLRVVAQTPFGLKMYEAVGRQGPAFAVQAQFAAGLSDDQEMAILTARDFDSRKFALASQPPPDVGPVGEQGQVRSVDLVRLTPNRIRLNVGNGSGNLVVVSEAYHPGWKATLHGRPGEVIRANHALIGVYVPPGDHQVTLAFQPESFRFGLYVTLGAILVLTALGSATFGWRQEGTTRA